MKLRTVTAFVAWYGFWLGILIAVGGVSLLAGSNPEAFRYAGF